MGHGAAGPTLSEQEYLAFERSSPEKHEFADGEIFAMSGGTAEHSAVTLNLLAELRSALAGRGCRAFESNMRVHVPATGRYVYPDGRVGAASGESSLRVHVPRAHRIATGPIVRGKRTNTARGGLRCGRHRARLGPPRLAAARSDGDAPMKKTIAQASLLLSFVAMTGCAGFQEEDALPECPASRAQQAQAIQPQEAHGPPAALSGIWAGQGCQSDGPCWTVQIALSWDDAGRPFGKIAYPSVPCKARLEFARWEDGDVAVFRERFANAGKCVPDGFLRLHLVDDDSLGFVWSYPNGRIDAATTLDRVQ